MGADYAFQAESVAIRRLRPARVPAEDAAFATLASIAWRGVRLADVGLGNVVAVVGLTRARANWLA